MPSAREQLAGQLRAAWADLPDRPLTSPKQTRNVGAGDSLYRYYAGYADGFVSDVVGRLAPQDGLVLDPWNGSGTTTSVAAEHGLEALGLDLNPAATIIAQARLLQSDVAGSMLPLARKLMRSLDQASATEDDLLLKWMTPRTVGRIRRMGQTIHRALVDDPPLDDHGQWCSQVSAIGAVFYLGLFRTVRQAFAPFLGTNPTWIRQRVDPDDRVDIPLETLTQWFTGAMADLALGVKARGLSDDTTGSAEVAICDSTDLPLPKGSVDTVITSPPYCTRIDYAVAMLPELAALGMSPGAFRELRERLIGTPTMASQSATSEAIGSTAAAFINAVRSHSSRASSTYYAPFFSQYFAGMSTSLRELDRVIRPGGAAVLVVQDSYYKELHADVPQAIVDMALSQGWSMLARHDYKVVTKAYINSRARQYGAPRPATEAVLAFTR